MDDLSFSLKPESYDFLWAESERLGFSMPSDLQTGSLLKTLVSSKLNGHFLELGTGIGLSLSWILSGMIGNSTCISLDNDPVLIQAVTDVLLPDSRLEVLCADGADWLLSYKGEPFDLIFADTWPGKYSLLDEALALLKSGGFYVIDDMIQQPNWPDGHSQKAENLLYRLDSREDIYLTKLNWSTGLVVAVKK